MCLGQVPWFINFSIGFVDPAAPLQQLAQKLVKQRLSGGSNVNDLYSYLVSSGQFSCTSAHFAMIEPGGWKGDKRDFAAVIRRRFRCDYRWVRVVAEPE
jgi:hypothetical protein